MLTDQSRIVESESEITCVSCLVILDYRREAAKPRRKQLKGKTK